MKRLFILPLLITTLFTSGAFAQWGDTGKLNAWTSARVARANEGRKATPYLKEVRVAKNKGFDRVVFEFTGDVPRYFIEPVTPPITGTADEEIKVSGKYFVGITLMLLPYPEEEDKIPEAKIPEGRLNFPVISEVREIEWFEGDRPFVVGLKAKKLYRVRQLKNPARLVVDFKQ